MKIKLKYNKFKLIEKNTQDFSSRMDAIDFKNIIKENMVQGLTEKGYHVTNVNINERK